MENERLKKLVEEAAKKLLMPDEQMDEPDPETVKKIEELEEEIGPDDLLMMSMERTIDAMCMVLTDVVNRPLNGVGICEAAARIRDLAELTIGMYDRITMRSTLDRLHMMREVEQKNDENIRKWSDEHEQGDSGPRGDQGEG